MRLLPYPNQQLRWRKVVKHVFNQRERWWEIQGDLQSWARDMLALRAAGALRGEDGHRVCRTDVVALQIVSRNHDAWLDSASRACSQARETQRVYPTDRGTSCYVGAGGVTVYVAQGEQLVTCFRPRAAVGSKVSLERGTRAADERARKLMPDGYQHRAATRHATRRAALVGLSAERTAREGEAGHD